MTLRSVASVWALGLALLPIAAAQSRTSNAPPDPPQVLFKDLFVAVQSAHIFMDGKAFPDAVPKAAPQEILKHYHAERPVAPAALKQFVEKYFVLPAEVTEAPSPPGQVSIGAHIDGLWDPLTRASASSEPYSSLLTLPRPYVVPGGRFREMYYWDSYFTMLGLAESGRRDLLTGMVRDFAYLIDMYGHVPNGARTYYLSRSQPPFFFAMVGLVSPADPAAALADFLPQLKREYDFWMQGERGLKPGTSHRRVVAMPDGSVLNRFWDDRDTPRDEAYREDTDLVRASARPAAQLFRDIRAAAESGWDFGSRWFADGRTRATMQTTDIVPVDLNSLLFGLENAIRTGCERRGDAACAREFARRAAARRSSIDRYLWDEPFGAYLDYHWKKRTRTPRVSAATLYPLFVALASAPQAAAVARITARELLKDGGIVTTTADTGQQWDSPNGWAPLQWIAVSGLRENGQSALAATIACRWMVTVADVYRQSGKLVEKYDVLTTGRSGGGGEYPLQDGFGWTNGVMRKLMALYPADVDVSAAQCPAPPRELAPLGNPPERRTVVEMSRGAQPFT
ncbi:MAG: alpha,alpha-trehalase TreA [Steroidobacteraceae bacterium]